VSIKKLIPTDKYDVSKVQALKYYSGEEITEILPEIFEWLRDINWPVARELARVLPPYGSILLPYIKTALCSGDPQWQFCMLQVFIRELPKETSPLLVEVIQRIIDEPTQSEILEEIHLLARETLDLVLSKKHERVPNENK
jgi:hypothetical protein